VQRATALVVLVTSSVAAQDQLPRFQSSVDVTTVDCKVVNGDGTPVLNLKLTDFTVRIDGSRRRVVRAEQSTRRRAGSVPRDRHPKAPSRLTRRCELQSARDGAYLCAVAGGGVSENGSSV
jgi:hypothetical protein